MNLSDTIYNEIKRLYDSYKTQDKVADKCNTNQGKIQKILSKPGYCLGMKVETVEKMFPNATLHLTGDGNITQTVSHVNVKNGSVSLNNAPASDAQIKSAVDAFRHEVIDALIGLDIPPDALASVLKTIKELAT